MAESLYLKGKLSIMPSAEPAALTSLLATENGDYTPPVGYDGFYEAKVNVPQSGARLTNLTVTANGDYTPPSGFDGFGEVKVNVPTAQPRIEELTIITDSNGEVTYSISPNVDGYGPINVRTNVPNQYYIAAERVNIGDTSTYITAALDRAVASGEKYLISVLDMSTINDQVITIDFNSPVNIPLSGGGYGRVYFTPTSINLFDYGGNWRNIYIRLTRIPNDMEVPNE